jgi:type 1 glutamine amidotransferase/sugar phosphate isomerase/epimerase
MVPMRAKVLAVLVGAILGWPSTVRSADGQEATSKPVFERAPDALDRVSWRTRTLVGDDRLTNWNFAVATSTLAGLTFMEAVVRADAVAVDFVEGFSDQRLSPQLEKNLDYRLTPTERETVRNGMGPVRLVAYRVNTVPPEAVDRRRLFEFAREMGVATLVIPLSDQLAAVETLATEFGINVAIQGERFAVMKALENRSQRLGVSIDTGTWAQEGNGVGEGLASVSDRLLHVSLRDRSGRGPTATNVIPGEGIANLTRFFHELNRTKARPLVISLDATEAVTRPADLFRAVEAFEAVVQPAYGAHFAEFSRTVPIRRDLVRPNKGEAISEADRDRRSDEMRQRIRAAIPKAAAPPRKSRRLLVIESLHGMSHDTIPHANVMLEEMGKLTGAWTTEFDNDLHNLKYPKVKEYDGIFLNSIVGEFAPDADVRDGLLRFVREGGGIGGVHGTPWASRNWDEFGVLLGAKSAPHRIEQGVMRVFDTTSPVVKSFGSKPLNFREEYYRFEHQGPNRLRWEDVRVLLTVDLDDPVIEPRPWSGYKRPDKIYPVTWVRSFGKGRMFYSSLGHMPDTFTTPEIVAHFLAGVQFLLGDVEVDTTPNPVPGTSQGPALAPSMSPSQSPAATAAAPIQPLQVPSLSQRPNGSSLGTIRVGAADNNIWFGWRVGVQATALSPLTLSEALVTTDRLSVANVELSSSQIASVEVPKRLDSRLQPGERQAIVRRLRELNQQVLAYRVETLPSDPLARRRVFELARDITAPIIVVAEGTPNLEELDTLAEQFGLQVAIESETHPGTLAARLRPRSQRMGIAADLAAWARAGVQPLDGLASAKERLLLVTVQPLRDTARKVDEFFLAAYRAGVKPLSISIGSTGRTEADLVKTLSAFEQVMWPAMAERVRTVLASPAGAIRGPDRLDSGMRQQIADAAPRQSLAVPKKPRKLLVTDIQMYSGHSTIPHGNWLLEVIGKQTGAFEPVFSNDLSLLKYPKIKEFDAVYLNNVCGMVHNDLEVREGLLRFVREGGGIGGHHAVTYANNHWPEFADLMGGWAGAHHIEKQMIKVDDPASPLTRSFGSASFEHTDEFYIFPPFSPYSRDKQRILLSIDVEASDRATEGRFCAACTRPDQDYGLAWIKHYGKGRAYFTPLGHTTTFYTDSRWTTHLLAAIQYILGDLEADATPVALKGTRN